MAEQKLSQKQQNVVKMGELNILGHRFDQSEKSYSERDVILYALSVGEASNGLPKNPNDLSFVYEGEPGRNSLKVLPTFAVLYPASLIDQLLKIGKKFFDPALLLHGEQQVELFGPLPSHAKTYSNSRVTRLEDKGKAALIEVETVTVDASNGQKLAINRSVCFLRGAGGFSDPTQKKKSLPAVSSNQPSNSIPPAPATSAPLFSIEERTAASQALLYRLNGDLNPLHADPQYAKTAGFERPILHGLCTLGFAARAIVRSCCPSHPEAVRNLNVRFLLHVFPGETLVTDIWKVDGTDRFIFQTKVAERKAAVLRGTVTVQHQSAM